MAKEIEKKFLVNPKKLPKLRKGKYFIQAYLSLDPHIRIRIIDKEAVLTVKMLEKNTSERQEYEFSSNLSEDEVTELLRLAIKKPVEKVRYKITHQDLVWEVDVYLKENEGLITADIELESVDQKITFPDWVEKDKEITNDPKYFNVNLGDEPYGKWASK